MSAPGGSRSYRNPVVEDEDDEDIDDLDDVLASFNKKPDSTNNPTSAPPLASSAAPNASNSSVAEDDEDFEASLAEGMENLLRQLAGDHPPGPMPDLDSSSDSNSSGKGIDPNQGLKKLSSEEEEAAWQKAVEMMLSGEGLSALGLEDGLPQSKPTGDKGKAKSSGSGAVGGVPSFDETIRRTMESLKAGGEGSKASGAGLDGNDQDLAKLLKQLSMDPSALDGLGGDGEDDELGGLLDGMMNQLMTREILEEPMSELAAKYPAYLASPPSSVSAADLEKYRKQHTIVQDIVQTFKKPGFSDEKDGKEVARLVGEMQDLGGPPKEIMGDLPEGFDFGALGNEDGCVVM